MPQEWAKRMQAIEMAMKSQRCWQGRTGTVSKAYAEFDSNFEILRSFIASPPAVTLACDYMWNLRLQLQARFVPGVQLVVPRR